MFTSYQELLESDIELDPHNVLKLIDTHVLSPKCALEFYIGKVNYNCLNFDILKELFETHKLNVDGLYDFPTDSNEPTTLLNTFAEYRSIYGIKLALQLGANPNIKDSINYTPFQSLMSGHSSRDTGQNVQMVKDTINLFLNCGTSLILEEWQYTEDYLPYLLLDDYFKDIFKLITIVENITD